MNDDKILMYKLGTGSFVKSGYGRGREQFNIDEKAIINGKYYGAILNAGKLNNISLERIDKNADNHTSKIGGVTVIYFKEIEKNTTGIVAIAEKTTVYRELQKDEEIVKQRVHKFDSNPAHHLSKEGSENVGYHTITNVEDMHLLKENYIPINVPKECSYFFRAQRALSKEEKYRDLRNQIINKVCHFLN